MPTTLPCLALAILPGIVAQDHAAPQDPVAPTTPLVAATFYGWYRHPTHGFLNADGSDRLRLHFPDPASVDAHSAEWVAGEWREMQEAGLDAALVACGAPHSDPDGAAWLDAVQSALTQKGASAGSPRVALLLDFVDLARTLSRGLDATHPIDLFQAHASDTLKAVVRDFFTMLPAESIARVDERPIVVAHHRNAVERCPDDFWKSFADWFLQTFAVEPYLVLEDSWQMRDGFPRFQWTAPLIGSVPGEVVCIGPGFDDSRLSGRNSPLRMREDGLFYRHSWNQVLRGRRPRLVIVESWNDHWNGTGIEPMAETGESYSEWTRHAADFLRIPAAAARAAWPQESRSPAPPLTMQPAWRDRRFAGCNHVEYRPWQEISGIVVRPGSGSRLAFERTADGTALTRVEPRAQESTRALLCVADAFAHRECVDLAVRLRLHVVNHAPVTIAVEYFAGTETNTRPVRTEQHSIPGPSSTPAEWLVELPQVELADRFEGCADLVIHATHAFEIETVQIERRSRVHPGTGLAAHSSDWLEIDPALRAARIEALATLQVDSLRFAVSVDSDPAMDAERLVQLRAICSELVDHGIEPIVAFEPGPGLPASPRRWIEGIPALMQPLGPRARYVEIFPGFLARGVTPVAYLSLLHGVAKELHQVRPDACVILGAVDDLGIHEIEELDATRDWFSFDRVHLRQGALNGRLGSREFEAAVRESVARLQSGPWRDRKIALIAGDVGRATDPLREGFAAVLIELLQAAWSRMKLDPHPVQLLLDPALPVVSGIEPSRLLVELRTVISDLQPVPLREWNADSAFNAGVRTVLFSHGELIDEVGAAEWRRFLDRGGLIVLVGGLPVARTANHDATQQRWRVASSRQSALELQEELLLAPGLRSSFDRLMPALHVTAGKESPATAFPNLKGLADLAGEYHPLSRRTGRPRNPTIQVRYQSLIEARSSGATKTNDSTANDPPDCAGLFTYQGSRNGALLVVSLCFEPAPLDPEPLQAAVEHTQALCRELDLTWFWSEMCHSAESQRSGGLLDAAGKSTLLGEWWKQR